MKLTAPSSTFHVEHLPMTTQDLLDHEVTHRHAGNGYAVVEIIDKDWCRVTSKFCEKAQAFLAATSLLQVHMLSSPDGKGGMLPPAPVRLTKEELKKLDPLRSGLATGKIKVVETRFVKA